MASDEMPDQYFTYEGRLASFQPVRQTARRGSNAKGKAPKGPSWPIKTLDPDMFARAGFYYEPTPQCPDNTVCFLCCNNMAGWEADDNPFEEHLRLSPHCGWAIVAAIETGLNDFALDDPTSSAMLAARKATFAGRWPHDGKRGWKCKTKQLVDAGWKYTPTPDSDDMATCAYCQLALDGWEPKDNPMDEHYRRSPDCPFFSLMNQYKSAAPAKKKGKGKTARASKASRVSTQSVMTTTSDATSILDHTAAHDDSVVTTASIMTQGGTKRARAKKGTAVKGKKAKARKDEIVEVLEDPPEHVEPSHHGSFVEEDEDVKTETDEVPQKAAARGRKRMSTALEESDLAAAEAPAPKKRATRGRVASTQGGRQDLDRAIFDATPPEIDDAAIDAELKALEAEMEAEPQTLQVPKKGRQGGTRKASKQITKKSKTKAAVEAVPEPETEAAVDPAEDELAEGHESGRVSNATIVRTSLASTTSAPKKRGRPSKKSLSTQPKAEPVPKPEPTREPSLETEVEEDEPAPPVPEKVGVSKVTKKGRPSRDKSLPLPPPESDDEQPPSTPKASPSPAPRAKQATISPSQSPQSSDAENQPPSSKPSNTEKSSRVALAPIEATPVRASPSKRNIIAGLESTHPWTTADVEMILDELDQENALASSGFPSGIDLTSPEKQMTVEEWIYYNAQQAEKQLKDECENIVMRFEQEGSRAMQALEGIVVE
ncbi:hypothetical protein GGS20DRAFT_423879 [Poronia punctata]|nr:hypothetical protein GGS20DRAFT_423879 [Poronia punctata]